MSDPWNDAKAALNRRLFLGRLGTGVGTAALAHLLGLDARAAGASKGAGVEPPRRVPGLDRYPEFAQIGRAHV